MVCASLLLILSGVAAVTSCGGRKPAAGEPRKAIFIGNSFIYYGGCVEFGGQGRADSGLFHTICAANGFPVEVYDCTYGGHDLRDFTSEGCANEARHKHGEYGGCEGVGKDLLGGLDLSSFDYVFISEAGKDDEHFLEDFNKVKDRFKNPRTRFFYLSHPYTYMQGHRNILDRFPDLEKEGVKIVEWGRLVADLATGAVAIPGSTLRYDRNTFIKNRGDNFHENPLGGYITAQMAFCAMSGLPAQGQEYSFCGSVVDFGRFVAEHYESPSDTDFEDVFLSGRDMQEIQKLMDKYLSVEHTVKDD